MVCTETAITIGDVEIRKYRTRDGKTKLRFELRCGIVIALPELIDCKRLYELVRKEVPVELELD